MQYEIVGGSLPAVIVTLEDGEAMVTEKGAMSWMSPNMEMETSARGGLGKAFGRAFSGESMFQNVYTARGGQGMIAFASCFPGQILAQRIATGAEIVVQKSAFLASEPNVQTEVFFQKKLAGGLFGGEGFIMQRLCGEGLAFIEMDGHVVEYDLAAGKQLVLDTGHLAAMDATCSIDIQQVKGAKNVLFGGEGLFNTLVTGPGHVWVQTMPIATVAAAVNPFIPKS